ncbi:MAG: extracellular solute-binding protein [Candidatus Abyssobacteria bacterium SURF_5]|uniref:Extracellular solute-binding protein n=1 Tax=Abyssobacteria bacterium (strain SURF_5) TaxID=2093360 RepID=A0A3A4NAH5_ABYX5|nr:MAG: extracellular solute-binding protein [Candidatus Abyssubacteria bacterium SURF_5]
MLSFIRTARKIRPRRSSFLLFRPSFLFMLIVCLLSASALLSCGKKQNPLTIKIWEYPRWREDDQSVDRFYWIKQQITEFERLHPGVSIELTELTWEHGEDKKKIAITAGVGPDIITGVLPVQLIEGGFIESIDDHLTQEDRSDFLAPALESFTYNGRLYGVPWYVTGSVLFANLDLLEQCKLELPRDGWNHPEFLEFTRRLTRCGGDGRSDAAGFAFLLRPGDTGVWPFLFPDGMALDEQILPRGLGDAANATFLYNLVHAARVAPADCAAWDAETLWQRFVAQKNIAIAPLGIWAVPRLHALGDFRFDVLPYPAPSGNETAARAFIGTSGFVVLRQDDPQKRRLCIEFAKFLVRPDAQRDLRTYGVIPSRLSAGTIYADDAVMSKVQRILSAGQTVPRHAQWAKIDEKYQRELQLAFLGEKSLMSAVASGGKEIEALIKTAHERQAPEGSKASFKSVAIATAALFCAILPVLYLVRRRLESLSAYAFLFPALAIFAVFLLFPLVWVLLLTFQDFTFAQARPSWVGFRNLAAAVNDPVFRQAAINTLVYTVVVVPVNVVSALVVASLICPLSNRVRGFFRGAYYLPGVASVVVLTMAWRWMFNESFGILNAGLGFFGLPGVHWLTDSRIALWSVILTSIARPPGGPVLIYLAALDAIPKSLYDAGELDGASAFSKWWHLTLPLLRPTTLFLALTITIASFQVFTQVFILTDGGPGYATEVVAHRIYTAAIRDFEFGVAAAMSVLLFAIIMLASIVQYRFFRSDVEY